MGEWSPETYECRWIGDVQRPEVGARFKARNRRGWLRWSNSPTVIVADAGKEFAFSRTMIGAGEYVWRYRLEPADDGGTDISESYESVRPERWVNSMFAHLFTPGDEASYLRDTMTTTLDRIRAAVERPTTKAAHGADPQRVADERL